MYSYWSVGKPLIVSNASNGTWSPCGPPTRKSTRSSAELIVVPANHVNPSGFRWYIDPMMTKSEPSALAWVMSSSLAAMPTLPSPAARTWTIAGVFGPP